MPDYFCYICFSNYHYGYNDCSYYVAPNLFLPKINQILLARFVELLTMQEKIYLMFTNPSRFTSIGIKPVKAMRKNTISFTENILDADLIFAKKAIVNKSFWGNVKPRIALYIEHIEITLSWRNRLHFSSKELFLLLTFKTKSLKCKNIEFPPTVTFRQIVEAAPALEEIDIYQTNIEVDNTWVDLLSNLKNLRAISLTIRDLNTNIGQLAALLENNKNGLKICLYIIFPWGNSHDHAFTSMTRPLSSHFIQAEFNIWTSLEVSFIYDNGLSTPFHCKCFELKNLEASGSNKKKFF